jgi:hypothetical protein
MIQGGIKFIPLPGNEISVMRIDFAVCKTVQTLGTYVFDHETRNEEVFTHLYDCDYKYQHYVPVCGLLRCCI